MADMHIMAGDEIVMHTAVPDIDNAVGIKYRAAIVASGNSGTNMPDAVDDGSPLGWEITAAEKALVESGAIVETRTSFDFGGLSGTLAQKRDALLAIVADRGASVLARFQKSLEYFGYAGSAP